MGEVVAVKYEGGGMSGDAGGEGSWWEALAESGGAWLTVGVEADMIKSGEDTIEVASGLVEDVVLTSPSGEA
jgi:hypothetical protein